MNPLIDNTKRMRQWRDDFKKLRESSPMATRLNFWQRLIRVHLRRSKVVSRPLLPLAVPHE